MDAEEHKWRDKLFDGYDLKARIEALEGALRKVLDTYGVDPGVDFYAAMYEARALLGDGGAA